MPTDFVFRLSTYLTLALSCVLLGYAEWDLLREGAIFAWVVVGLLGVSFWAEGRYELSLAAANRLGLVIGILGLGWLAWHYLDDQSLMNTFPWPASLLPYLAPLLMVLMPAKLFRPKHVGDWWAMQGIGLAAAGLASAMAEDEVFGVLLGLYAIAGVSSLSLFYYLRSAGRIPPLPDTDPGPDPAVITSPAARGSLVVWRAVGWLVVAGAVALPLFFLTPRSGSTRWQLGKPRLETGFTGNQMVDLNRTGDLEVSREVAFTVRAWNPREPHRPDDWFDGSPKEDLAPTHRWRGVSFNSYENGRWVKASELGPVHLEIVPFIAPPQYAPPNLGPDQFNLEFRLRDRLMEPVLSDPIVWEPKAPATVFSIQRDGRVVPWLHMGDGSFRPLASFPSQPSRYFQVTRPGTHGDPNLGSGFTLTTEAGLLPGQLNGALAGYRTVPLRLARLKRWSRELVARLSATDPKLTGVMDRASDRAGFELAPQDWEAVGRAFAGYLQGSGEYTYSDKLRRLDKATDPVEEFLFTSKTGHCQRFASALALMLRAVGVPTVYVLGFKGCEHNGDGLYTVRQEHAHAWVEVLVPRGDKWHWLSLDPTSDFGGEDETSTLTGWFGTAKQTGVAFFLDFIVGYNPERRKQAVDALNEKIRSGWWAVGLIPAGLVGLLVVRAARRRGWFRATDDGRLTVTGLPWFDRLAASLGFMVGLYPARYPGMPWYDRMVATLVAHGHPVPPSATPAEYATEVAAALAARPGTAGVADIPTEVTAAFYLSRYADRPPSAEEVSRLDAAVARLEAALGR